MLGNGESGLRGKQPPPRSFKEHDAQLPFQFGDVSSDGWLTQTLGARGAEQRAAIEYGQKSAHESPVERAHLVFLIHI